jgi:hypothetical protein
MHSELESRGLDLNPHVCRGLDTAGSHTRIVAEPRSLNGRRQHRLPSTIPSATGRTASASSTGPPTSTRTACPASPPWASSSFPQSPSARPAPDRPPPLPRPAVCAAARATRRRGPPATSCGSQSQRRTASDAGRRSSARGPRRADAPGVARRQARRASLAARAAVLVDCAAAAPMPHPVLGAARPWGPCGGPCCGPRAGCRSGPTPQGVGPGSGRGGTLWSVARVCRRRVCVCVCVCVFGPPRR